MLLYVDDTDTDIRYWGSWTATSNPTILEGYGGAVYGTLHGTSGSANFSFSFSGSYVAVFLLSESRVSSYNCTIDGVALLPQATDLSTRTFNNPNPEGIAACSGPVNDDGKSHELQVTISGSASNPIFFDYLQYAPTETMTSSDLVSSLGQSSVVVESTNLDTKGLLPGSTVDFTFIGSSATICGTFDPEPGSYFASPISYTIDGGSPVTFTISNPPTNTTTPTEDQVLIQTPHYPFGKHVLHVEFLWTNHTVPFIPIAFSVQNKTSRVDLTPLSSSSSPSTSSWSSSPWPSPSTSPSTGSTPALSRSGNHLAILGIALGTIILITVLLFAIVLVRRKSRGPVEYIPHHLLQESTIHPPSHNSPHNHRTSRKTASSRPTSGFNPPRRTPSPLEFTPVPPNSGSPEPHHKPEDEAQSELIEVLPRYETMNDGIT